MSNELTEKENQGKTQGEPKTYAKRRQEERQEAMREFIAGKNYLVAIDKTLNEEIKPEQLAEIKFKTETRLKLLNKILPDVKMVENSGEMTLYSGLVKIPTKNE